MQSNSTEAGMRLALADPPRVLSVNGCIEELTGFAPRDWLSSTISLRDRIHPGDAQTSNILLSPDLLNPYGSANLRLRHADGKIRTIHASFTKEHCQNTGEVILSLTLEPAQSDPNPALRIVADSFRTLMDSTGDCMYLKNRNHAFVGATSRMSDFIGDHDRNVDFTGKTGYDLYPEDLADTLYARDQQVLIAGHAPNEIQRLQLFDGSHRWVDNRKYPLKTSDGQIIGIFGICPDITEPIDADHKLRESRELFQLFIERAPAALAMLDRDMRYLAVSRRWCEDFGLRSEDLLGRSHYEALPEIPDRWKAVHRRALDGEDLYCEEDRFVRADFSIQWLRWEIHPWRTAEGSVGGILIFSEDITQRKKDKEQLQLAASVFTNASEGILICDPQGAILDVNEMFTRITGYTRAEVIGRNPRILKSGRQSDAFYSDLWRSLLEN